MVQRNHDPSNSTIIAGFTGIQITLLREVFGALIAQLRFIVMVSLVLDELLIWRMCST
jgi:hypothetical protein